MCCNNCLHYFCFALYTRHWWGGSGSGKRSCSAVIWAVGVHFSWTKLKRKGRGRKEERLRHWDHSPAIRGNTSYNALIKGSKSIKYILSYIKLLLYLKDGSRCSLLQPCEMSFNYQKNFSAGQNIPVSSSDNTKFNIHT